MTEKVEPLWTKNYISIFISNLFQFMGFYILIPVLPLYINSIGGSLQEVGYIVSATSVGSILIRPLTGFILTNNSKRRIVIIALVLVAIAIYLHSVVSILPLFFLLRLIMGFFWSFSTAGIGSMIPDVTPHARMGEGVGYYGLSNTFAMAIAPVIGGICIAVQNYKLAFWFSGAILAIAIIFVLSINYKQVMYKPEKISLHAFLRKRYCLYLL